MTRFKAHNGDRFIVRLRDVGDKFAILKKKKELYMKKGGKRVPIFVDDDLSKEDRVVQQKARMECKRLREGGHEAKVGHKRIFVDGIEMRCDREADIFR